VNSYGAAGVYEAQTAGRSRRSQVREQGNRGACGGTAGSRHGDVAGALARQGDGGRRRTNSLVSADRGVSVAPAKTELGADIAGKLARSSHHPSFNFDFLRLAVELRQQAVDGRKR